MSCVLNTKFFNFLQITCFICKNLFATACYSIKICFSLPFMSFLWMLSTHLFNTKRINTPTKINMSPFKGTMNQWGVDIWTNPWKSQGKFLSFQGCLKTKRPNAPRLDSFIHQAQRSGRRIVLMTFSSMPVGERTVLPTICLIELWCGKWVVFCLLVGKKKSMFLLGWLWIISNRW